MHITYLLLNFSECCVAGQLTGIPTGIGNPTRQNKSFHMTGVIINKYIHYKQNNYIGLIIIIGSLLGISFLTTVE